MLKRLFPPMTDRPEKGMAVAVFFYGLVAYILLPFLLVFMGADVWDDTGMTAWLELVYHVLNGVVVAAMFGSYLGESFFNVQLYTKKFFKTVGLASLLMLCLAVELQFGLGFWLGDAYPINELAVAMTSGLLVAELPLWGTLCYSLATPFAVAGLFYVVGFAPWSCRKPWLGYLTVLVAALIPVLLDVNWRGGWELALPIYILQLPIHLIACWSYQKADTIWAPITCLSIFNLGTALLGLL